MTKWADMTEEQKEKARERHRNDYEKHRATRLEYQRKYRLNMTEEQKEKQRQHHRNNYEKYRSDRLDYQRKYRIAQKKV
jgi:hypothetical protein